MPQKEFERVQKVWQTEGVKLPSKRSLEKKSQELLKLTTQPMTEVCSFSVDNWVAQLSKLATP
jgi:hypothetical protein